MKIYMTDKDNQTLKFVEEYGSITINQAAKLFYSNQIYGQQYAGKKLNKLVRYEKLKVYRDMHDNQNIYYTDNKLSFHDLLALDYYCNIISSGANVLYFKRNPFWMSKKYFSDAYCCYSCNNFIYFDFVEIVNTHRFNKNKYIDIFNSQEPQQYDNQIYKQIGGDKDINIFPRIILIDNTVHKDEYLFINNDIKIIQLDYKFNNILKIFLEPSILLK